MKVPDTTLNVLTRISPSRYTALKKCPYRVVLSNSFKSPLLPYPPASHLGNVIHECIRLLMTGQVKSEQDFYRTWDALVFNEEEKLKEAGFDYFMPLKTNVPGYSMKKLQVRALIQERGEDQEKTGNAGCSNEKWLESRDHQIGGYVDLILQVNDFVKISDFKTGKILKLEGEVKEEYDEQLKLYACLYMETFGRYPDQISLIELSGKEHIIPFKPAECQAIADESRQLLQKVNSLIQKEDWENLASPCPENCKNCLYKPACRFYWTTGPLETGSLFTDIRGIVKSIKQYKNGNINLQILNGSDQYTVTQIKMKGGDDLFDLLEKEAGTFNVMRTGTRNFFQAGKLTMVYELQP